MAESSDPRALPALPQDAWRRILIENALDAVIGIDSSGHVVEWNRQAEVVFGWRKGEALDRELAELIIPIDAREAHRQGMRRFLAAGEGPLLNRRIEVEALHRNGQHFPVELTIIPIPVGGSYLFYSFVRDVSERRDFERQRAAALEAEAALRNEAENRERQLQLIMDASPAFISFLDRMGRYRFVNKRYEQWFGVSREEIRGKSILEVVGEAAHAAARPHFERALAGEALHYEASLVGTKGQRLLLEVEYAPFRGVQNEISGVVVIAHDITDRKLREQDQRFLVQLGTRLASKTEVDALVRETTDALATYLDVTRCWFSEIDDARASALVHQDYAKDLPPLRGTHSLEGFGPEMVASWRSGETIINMDVKTDPRTAAHADAHLALGICSFVTAPMVRHGHLVGALNVAAAAPRIWSRREQELVRSVAEALWPVIENARLIGALTLERRRLESVLEQLPVGVLISDLEGAPTMRNARMDEILGRFPAASMQEYEQFVGFRPDGSRYQPDEWPLARVLTRGEVVRDEEVTLVRLDGSRVTLSLSAGPVRGDAGDIVAAVLVTIDISHRKQMEERLKEAIQARDEFLSLASHELRTPVTSMSLQFQSAAKKLEQGLLDVLSPERSRKRIQLANRQLARMTRLIDQMLDVSRIATQRMNIRAESIDMAALVREVLERFEGDFQEKGVVLDVSLAAGATVKGDRFRLEQVVENLLTNALKYGEARPVRVEVREDARNVELRVEDEGAGFDPADAERIFQRFERATSKNISGLGLGLYLSRQIAEAHGGTIWAELRPGRGACFTVRLPRAS